MYPALFGMLTLKYNLKNRYFALKDMFSYYTCSFFLYIMYFTISYICFYCI